MILVSGCILHGSLHFDDACPVKEKNPAVLSDELESHIYMVEYGDSRKPLDLKEEVRLILRVLESRVAEVGSGAWERAARVAREAELRRPYEAMGLAGIIQKHFSEFSLK